MDHIVTIIVGGFLLGLAGSLHCACMCGGIASGALFILHPVTLRQRVVTLLQLQAGRITAYSLAGGIAASATSLAINPAATSMTFQMLQWAGSAVLMWTGLSMAGMLPRIALSPNPTVSISSLLAPVLAPLKSHPRFGPIAMGFSWGLTPCPMVYAALITSALSGTFANGAMWMLAFGAGTLPSVTGAALGITRLAHAKRGRGADIAAGLAIAAFGVSSVYAGLPASALFCAGR